MIHLKKRETPFGYSIDIDTDEGLFRIYYGGNYDLYFRYQYQGSILKTEDTKEFYITKENYYLFSLFDTLYHRVKNYEIFYPNQDFDDEFGFGDTSDSNRQQREMDRNNSQRLFLNNSIEWHSDDYIYEEASILKIEKLEEMYKITFYKGKEEGDFFTYAVRISNSGSRYGYFHIVFMDMYNNLCGYDDTYHQIHIEEYLYQKKILQKKKTI